MSGDPHRLSTSSDVDRSITILGFNASHSSPTRYGLNHDQKMVYYVADKPSNLSLLCANAYCQEGCAVLFAQDGLVLSMRVKSPLSKNLSTNILSSNALK